MKDLITKTVFSVALALALGSVVPATSAYGGWDPVETIKDDFDGSEWHLTQYSDGIQGMIFLCADTWASVRFFDYTADDLGGIEDIVVVEEKFGQEAPDFSALSFTGYQQFAVDASFDSQSDFKRYSSKVASAHSFAVRFYDRAGRKFVVNVDTVGLDRRLDDLYGRCGIE